MRNDPFANSVRQQANPTYRWELLLWLWLAFFLNQADRQVFNVVLPLLQSDLHLSYLQIGLVATAFTAAIGVTVPVAGYFGDIWSRKSIIVISLIVWSVATLLTGFGTGLAYLIMIRGVATAGGEAFYAPAANALISKYHENTRAQALAVHQTALYTGIIVSGWAAGYVGERFGWRSAFWIFGGVGLILAICMRKRLLPEPTSLGYRGAPPQQVFLNIIRRPTVLFLGLAFACMIFVNVGYLTWTPTYLYRHFGLSLAEAGFFSMLYHHLGAYLGVVVGGRLSDFVARRRPSFRLKMQALALLLGAPFIFMVGRFQDVHMVYLMLGVFGFFRGVYDSNIYAALYEIMPAEVRAASSAVMIAVAFSAGAVAPAVLGMIGETAGLGVGISSLSIAYLCGAMFIFSGLRFFAIDRAEVVQHTDA